MQNNAFGLNLNDYDFEDAQLSADINEREVEPGLLFACLYLRKHPHFTTRSQHNQETEKAPPR